MTTLRNASVACLVRRGKVSSRKHYIRFWSQSSKLRLQYTSKPVAEQALPAPVFYPLQKKTFSFFGSLAKDSSMRRFSEQHAPFFVVVAWGGAVQSRGGGWLAVLEVLRSVCAWPRQSIEARHLVSCACFVCEQHVCASGGVHCT